MPATRPVRLNVLSDLHLSHAGLARPLAQADIVVLAGDIARPRQAIDWALRLDKPVVYVAGNHEYYGSSLSRCIASLKDHSRGTQVHVLDQDELILHGLRFLGATLWTDFLLFGPGPQRELAIEQAQKFIRDFSHIRSDAKPDQPFSPHESAAVFKNHFSWLQHQLRQPFDGPTVVVTHHAPSPKSIHPRFEGSLINACFVSDAQRLMDGARVPLWIHGHTHDSFDYTVNGTRVVCNPRGYAKDGINENTAFDSDLVISVG